MSEVQVSGDGPQALPSGLCADRQGFDAAEPKGVYIPFGEGGGADDHHRWVLIARDQAGVQFFANHQAR